jgi:N-carbamoyl-L-amino-acid hydrolase
VSTAVEARSFDRMWKQLHEIGRDGHTNGYRRFAWTAEDATLREWFTAMAAERGLDVTTDRVGNLWAWTSDPDAAVAAGDPGLVIGSHLDSVPDGGAFDGPLGVVSSFAALDAVRATGAELRRPLGIVCFGDEEGARFGIACTGSRLLTGEMTPERAGQLRDENGVALPEAMRRGGVAVEHLGRDEQALRRIGGFIELHVEQGRGLIDLGAPVAVASAIRPHGRWRLELAGEANHAGTTLLVDRHDPMLDLAQVILTARSAAAERGCVATVGKVRVRPNGVNAIPSAVTAWLDARGAVADDVRAVAEAVGVAGRTVAEEESFTPATVFDADLRDRLARALGRAAGPAPILESGAGHDAGILAEAGIPSAMVFVRNPTGISHSPAEFAERDDCLAGVAALTAVVRELAG